MNPDCPTDSDRRAINFLAEQFLPLMGPGSTLASFREMIRAMRYIAWKRGLLPDQVARMIEQDWSLRPGTDPRGIAEAIIASFFNPNRNPPPLTEI